MNIAGGCYCIICCEYEQNHKITTEIFHIALTSGIEKCLKL